MQDDSPIASVPGSPTRIALVSDIHVTMDLAGDHAVYRQRLTQTLAEVERAGVDLVLLGGDLTEHGTPAELAEARRMLEGVREPVVAIPGNHDVGDKRTPGRDRGVTAESVRRYEAEFGESFGIGTYAAVRVIALNASLFGSGLVYEAAQWEMLEDALRSPAHSPTIVLLHYPPFLELPDEPQSAYWTVDPEPRGRLIKLFEKGGTAVVLSGHLHRPLDHRVNGVRYLTAPPVSFGLPIGKQPEGWMLVTVTSEGDVRAELRYLGAGTS